MSKRRVLVVDDDPTIADSLAARLRAEGLDVVGAALTGSCALSIIGLLLLLVLIVPRQKSKPSSATGHQLVQQSAPVQPVEVAGFLQGRDG